MDIVDEADVSDWVEETYGVTAMTEFIPFRGVSVARVSVMMGGDLYCGVGFSWLGERGVSVWWKACEQLAFHVPRDAWMYQERLRLSPN